RLEGRQLRQCLGSGVDHPVADRRVCGPMRNQSPMHELALVSAPVSDDDGNRRGNLFGGDAKARRVLWQIAVQVPADLYVTEPKPMSEGGLLFWGIGLLRWLGNPALTFCRLLWVGSVSGV